MAINDLRATLSKQHYGLIGNHSAVKICTWTKKSLVNDGVCYKQKFYGIRSHLCCQMTPAVGYCQNNCVYCWRVLDYSPVKEIKDVDEPEDIYKGCVREQRRLLTGFGGADTCDKAKLKAAQDPEHFAISLSGEPTMYPKLSELIRLLHSKGKTTFVVSNGMLPDVLERIEIPTQLYLSLSVPDESLFDEIHNPLHKHGWEKLNRSLDVIRKLRNRTRTTIRVTAIKGMNMVRPGLWAELIEKADPLFVEVKAYMFVGASRQRMGLGNMPYHEDIIKFSKEIEEHSGYKIIDEKPESRVVLMMKKDVKDRILRFE
jgi:tRNA wybutosine-synthesizing protein 1